ncbi:MAG: hypothetical protein WC241_00760 [Candidatus Paceibacterota bacterium]|jgi:hypothetical protein
MVTSELIEYIKSQLSKNIPKNLIILRLSEVGWKIEDINEGFPATEIKKTIDPYRELPEITEQTLNNINIKEEELKVEKVKEEVKEEPVVLAPIIKTTQIEVSPLELYKREIKTATEEATTTTIVKEAVIDTKPVIEPTIAPVVESVVEPVVEKKEELIPIINIKKTPPTFNPAPNMVAPVIEKEPVVNPVVAPKRMSDIAPRGAMISSYSQDILNSTKEVSSLDNTTKRRSPLKWTIIIVAICILGGMIFAFVEGYLKIPWSNLSLSVVKKDPKVIILDTATSLSKLKSYKTETNINISSPSLSNITTGLSSGEVVTSRERDSISINLKGSSNNKNDKLLFDYNLDLKSSILKNEIISHIQSDGTLLSVLVPDLHLILGEDAPAPATVSMTSDQLGLIVPLFSTKAQDAIKKIDIYNIASKGVPLYVKNETSTIFKDFIEGLEYTNKEDEVIRGVDTYHYELTASRPLTKNFLNSLSELFVIELSPDQKKNLDEALGASTITSFEVWIGKNDNNLYKFKFTLNAPLSRVLGLNDSGIAGNEVKLDWMTTFYDLNVNNEIALPSGQMTIDDFIKNIKDTKIKNIISSFKPETMSFRNAVGSYGSRSNPTGSCTNPNPGSLFSPQGHPKGAGTAISSIAGSMNSLLSITNGAGLCYSQPNAWALAIPLSSSPSFYCADSTGKIVSLGAPITGTICK